MKKKMILIVLVAVSLTAWSQPNRGQRPEPPSLEERLEKAQEQLTLTDEQLAEWRVIFEKYDDHIQEARQNRDRLAGESLRASLDQELMATLDEEQQEKFKAMQKQRTKRKRRRG